MNASPWDNIALWTLSRLFSLPLFEFLRFNITCSYSFNEGSRFNNSLDIGFFFCWQAAMRRWFVVGLCRRRVAPKNWIQTFEKRKSPSQANQSRSKILLSKLSSRISRSVPRNKKLLKDLFKVSKCKMSVLERLAKRKLDKNVACGCTCLYEAVLQVNITLDSITYHG